MFDENSAECYKNLLYLRFCLVLGIIKSKMSARHHLCDYDRGREVGRLEADRSVTTVAAALGVSKRVIPLLKKVTEGGNTL
ncbi:hypothetical protein TNCV_2679311 [Trichonephila clavipes]|nr:hypothetical protein TNCV_2679311 [Trichonephila clavipes]